jgi:GNAT superfamily N-acetyltransferase
VDDELAGMARVIGDQGLAYYVHDVIVVPAHQRQGIGTQMMDRVMAYLNQASQTATLGLMSAPGKEAFYEKYGFVSRPTDRMGAGMTLHQGG